VLRPAATFATRGGACGPEPVPAPSATNAAAVGPKILAAAGRVYRAGVKVAFGTDAGVYPHGENARAFALMVKAGMSLLLTIQAATIHAARLLRQPGRIGVVASGSWTDVIAVQGDPLAEVTRLQDVSFVMKGGKVYRLDGRPVE
jgi:imidazolonepropionase-like amidohydrolase